MTKTVLILGGSSGIGKAIAERFADEGWTVIVGSDNLRACREVVENLKGEGHLALKVDVSSDEEILNLKTQITGKFGSFQTLINSIGVGGRHEVLHEHFTEWELPFKVMLYGAIKICRALVPVMEDGGRIIHITSIHYERVVTGSSAYGMAKAAITQLTRSLAVELAPRNILANTIAPGFVNTPSSIKEDGKNEMNSDWFKDNYIKYDHLPLKRAARPEEIAGVAWFLSGSDASYMTGSVVTVDGGLTITF